MSTRSDSLDQPTTPDRVAYELGVMLDAADFRAEQDYHRGRLARALTFLHGSGTVAGLKVELISRAQPAPAPALEEVHVAPGLAVDRIGRLIEVPSTLSELPGRCVNLARWLAFTEGERGRSELGLRRSDRLRAAFRPTDPNDNVAPVPGQLIIDVFLRYAACDRGYTQAFAQGPLDALNQLAPARTRDGFEIQLVPRGEADPPLPASHWAELRALAPGDRAGRLRELIFAAWEELRPRERDDPRANDPIAPDWLDPQHDKHWILLARLRIPCSDGGVDRPALRDLTQPVQVQNEVRSFAFTNAALAQLLF